MMRFGTAGSPESTSGGGTAGGIKRVRELELDAMEVQFVRGVKMGEAKAAEVKVTAETCGITLSCHAPYYINLASPDKQKAKDSMSRLFDAARIGALCGAKNIVFHAGFYMDKEPEKVYSEIRNSIEEVQTMLKNSEVSDITLRPELMGKPTQFGALSELIRLGRDLENVLPCVDYSHFFTRSIGTSNSYDAFMDVLDQIHSGLGDRGIKNMHIHLSGIEYGPRGERKHLPVEDSEIKYKDILKALKTAGAEGTIICESPDVSKEENAATFKKYFNKIIKDKGCR